MGDIDVDNAVDGNPLEWFFFLFAIAAEQKDCWIDLLLARHVGSIIRRISSIIRDIAPLFKVDIYHQKDGAVDDFSFGLMFLPQYVQVHTGITSSGIINMTKGDKNGILCDHAVTSRVFYKMI